MTWLTQKLGNDTTKESDRTADRRPERSADPAPIKVSPAPAKSAPISLPPPRGNAVIGQSMKIKGELTGSEDLTIDGTVEGTVLLSDHTLTIGPNGNVVASINAKAVIVAGRLEGNIDANERVEVTNTGFMKGDIRAPQVSLADGAKLKGSIDMDTDSATAVTLRSNSSKDSRNQPAQTRGNGGGSYSEVPAGTGSTGR